MSVICFGEFAVEGASVRVPLNCLVVLMSSKLRLSLRVALLRRWLIFIKALLCLIGVLLLWNRAMWRVVHWLMRRPRRKRMVFMSNTCSVIVIG